MDTLESIANQINAQLPDVMSGTLLFFGDIFGGRIDNIHTIQEVAVANGALEFRFGSGERLRVWKPEDVRVSAVEFRISRARKVRWEWFLYGSERAPENLRYIAYEVADRSVDVATNYGESRSASVERPAVEILV